MVSWTFSHCSLHQYTLASKILPLHLMEVIDIAVKVINFICLRTKNHWLSTFGQRNGSATCGTFVLYQICRLLRGKCVFHLEEQKSEVKIFLQENKNNRHVQFHNEEFVVMLMYLANVCGHLNKFVFARL